VTKLLEQRCLSSQTEGGCAQNISSDDRLSVCRKSLFLSRDLKSKVKNFIEQKLFLIKLSSFFMKQNYFVLETKIWTKNQNG
jgi:hypothetical protein